MNECEYRTYLECKKEGYICPHCPYPELEWDEEEHQWESERDDGRGDEWHSLFTR